MDKSDGSTLTALRELRIAIDLQLVWLRRLLGVRVGLGCVG